MKDVIAVFDIGKTNKKILLFDHDLRIVYQHEQRFEEIEDEDGFKCDDISAIKDWIIQTLREINDNSEFRIRVVNFATYGATLMHIDKNGRPLTPLYNYLKPMPPEITESLYQKNGGEVEFARRTASPILGFLNSGLQILWLKKTKPDIFKNIQDSLHFPQYCSFLLSGKAVSEYTSIGCHTAMWDFDHLSYHPWLKDEGILLPDPVSNSLVYETQFPEFNFSTGIGIHDSSASLAPYILGSNEKFILLSTGTWSIHMNPFNNSPLTREELENDCLSYMSINQKPVKSSRFFLGHIHDVNIENLIAYFDVDKDEYKRIKPDARIIKKAHKKGPLFFKNGIPEGYTDNDIDLSVFDNFTEAYHWLMIDLTRFCIKSIKYILPPDDDISSIYISGGFSRNEIFVCYLATEFWNKKVFTSEIDNATALGAALVVQKELTGSGSPSIDLGLRKTCPVV